MQISIADYRIDQLLLKLFDIAAQFDFEPNMPVDTAMLITTLPSLLDKAMNAMHEAVKVYSDEYEDGYIIDTITVYEPSPPSSFFDYDDLPNAAYDVLSSDLKDLYDNLNDPDYLAELVSPEHKRIIKEYFHEFKYSSSYGCVDYFDLRFGLPSYPYIVRVFYNWEISALDLGDALKDLIVDLFEYVTSALVKLHTDGDMEAARRALYDVYYSITEHHSETIEKLALVTDLHIDIDSFRYDFDKDVHFSGADELAHTALQTLFEFLTELTESLVEWEADARWFVEECRACFKAFNELIDAIQKQFKDLEVRAEDKETWRDFVAEVYPEYYAEIYEPDAVAGGCNAS